MAATKVLTSTGLFLALFALGLLAIAICTDYWYETDARKHRERCKNYANKRNDPGYIYISNHNLPLRMPQKDGSVKGSDARAGTLSRYKRHFLAAASAMESHCSRQFNSTVSGLWRKCHRDGFDLETDDLISKGWNSFALRSRSIFPRKLQWEKLRCPTNNYTHRWMFCHGFTCYYWYQDLAYNRDRYIFKIGIKIMLIMQTRLVKPFLVSMHFNALYATHLHIISTNLLSRIRFSCSQAVTCLECFDERILKARF